jgi:predicted DNA-binding transcriptional regulator AlpA
MTHPASCASDVPDALVPDPVVWREFGISSMTGWRWTNDPELNFPAPVKIRGRCFRSRRALEAFKERLMRGALASRSEVA